MEKLRLLFATRLAFLLDPGEEEGMRADPNPIITDRASPQL